MRPSVLSFDPEPCRPGMPWGWQGAHVAAWERSVSRYFRTCQQDRFTDKTITTPESLREELVQIRYRGYAFDDEERTVGMRCVASPIINLYDEAVACISVFVPTHRMPQKRIVEMGALVRIRTHKFD